MNTATRRKFAAKYEHSGWGITLVIFGVLGIIGGIRDDLTVIIFAVGLLVWGIYLLTPQ